MSCSRFNSSVACTSSTRQGVIFEDDDSIQGQKELSVLLHYAVKPEDVGDPIFAGGWSILSRVELHVHFTPVRSSRACSQNEGNLNIAYMGNADYERARMPDS